MGFLPILIFFIIALLSAGGLLIASRLLGPHRHDRNKLTTYECGIEPRHNELDEEAQIPIKYANVALIFILFDVETAFIIPWAVLFRSQLESGSGLYAIVFMAVFLFLLLLGLLYAYQRQVFQWD